MSKKLKEQPPLFSKPLSKEINLNVEEGRYFYSRGGWIAKVIHVDTRPPGRFYAIHNPGTSFESSPIIHELKTGYATPMFSIGEPPSYTGHPADLVKEAIAE